MINLVKIENNKLICLYKVSKDNVFKTEGRQVKKIEDPNSYFEFDIDPFYDLENNCIRYVNSSANSMNLDQHSFGYRII